VRDLIYLSIPTNVAGGFFSIYVSVFLLDLGVSAEIVGLALAADGATMVLSAIPLGIVSDRKGRKVMLILGSLLFSPILVILASTTETAWLVIAGVLGGVSEAAFLSTWNALIADGTPAASRNAAFSMSFIVSTTTGGLGFALPFIFPGLEGWTGLSIAALHRDTLVLFAVLSALTPIGLAVLLRGYREYLRPRTAPAGARPLGDRLRQLRGRLKELRLLLTFSGINGLIGLGAGFIVPLIGTWFRLRFGIPDAYSGPLLAVANLTMGFAAFTSPRLARHLGPVRAAALVQALSTVLMLSLAFVPNPFLAGGLYVVRAALMNMASPIMDAYLMDLVRPQERGFASALASIIWRMPNSASTVVGGWLLYQGQYQLPFLIAGGLYAVGVSLFFAVFHAIEPREHAAAESAEQGVRGS
jgi:MFS family permease